MTPTKRKTEYLDVYEGIHAELVSSKRFDREHRFKHHISRTDRHDQGYGGKG